jgi:hypothetical protein
MLLYLQITLSLGCHPVALLLHRRRQTVMSNNNTWAHETILQINIRKKNIPFH